MKWLLPSEKTKRKKGKQLLYTRASAAKRHSLLLAYILFTLPIFGRSGDSTATFYLQKGEQFIATGELDSAFYYLIQARDISQDRADTKSEISALNRLGMLNDQIGNRIEARQLFGQVRKLAELIGDSISIADAYNNIGTSFIFESKLDSASEYFTLASGILTKTANEDRLASFLINRGTVFIGREHYEDAISSFKEALEICKNSKDSSNQVVSILNLGVAYLGKDEFDSSLYYLKHGNELARLWNFPNLTRYAILNLGDLHYNFEEYKVAADYYWRYYEVVDSLYSAETLSKIEALRVDYESAQHKLELKESELKSAQRSKWFIGIASFLLLTIITVVLIYYRRISVHRAREHALMEARESENKRISDLLWKEIGSAVKEKKLVLPGVELPEHSIGGAIEAAKFMANHQYNPFLQISLTRAVQHLMNNLTEDRPFEFSLEADEIQLEKSEKLAVYRVIESLLVDAAENQRTGVILVRLKSEDSKLTIYIKSEKTNEKKTMMYRSAEARVDQLRGKIQRSNKGDFQQSEVLIPLN